MKNRRMYGVAIWSVLALSALGTKVVFAQDVSSGQDAGSTRPYTAAEGASGHMILSMTGVVRNGVHMLPQDTSFDTALVRRTHEWIQSTAASPVRGLQLDALGELYVDANDDESAQAQFAARLATPGLSENDSAYTLALATRIFGRDARSAVRMRVAHRYLALLDAMPSTVSPWQYEAHVTMGMSYDLAGDAGATIVQLRSAFYGAERIPYVLRGGVLNTSPIMPFVVLANALADLPDGRSQIDSMGRVLMRLAQPSAKQLSDTLEYAGMRDAFTADVTQTLQVTDHLGRPAPPIIAMYWYNMPQPGPVPDSTAPGARRLLVDDGVIRVIHFGGRGGGPSAAARTVLQHLHSTFPATVQELYIEETRGYWGYSVCSGSEEAEHLRHAYLDREKLTIPVVIWAGPMYTTPDGGVVPQYNPSLDAYLVDKSMEMAPIVIVDGRGIVRKVINANADEEGALERRLVRYVRTLEAKAEPMTKAAP